MSITLFCLVKGNTSTNAFSVKINRDEPICEFKKLIKAEKQNVFSGIDADKLKLWKVEIPKDRDDLLTDLALQDTLKLSAMKEISKYFPGEPADESIHVIVEVPTEHIHVIAESRVETAPRDLVYIFVDNSNLFIQGRYSVGLLENIGYFDRRERCMYFNDLFIDYGQLVETIRGERNVVESLLVGSRPPDTDSVWRHAKDKGFKVKVYDKNILGNEKKVDMKIGTAITRTVMKNSPGTIALVAGDGGYEPALEIVQEEGWNMETWFWRRENSLELLNGGKILPFIGLSNSVIIHAEYHSLDDFYWAFTYGVGCDDEKYAIDVNGVMCSWTNREMLNWCYTLRVFGWWDRMDRSQGFRLYFTKKRYYQTARRWMGSNNIDFWDVV